MFSQGFFEGILNNFELFGPEDWEVKNSRFLTKNAQGRLLRDQHILTCSTFFHHIFSSVECDSM